MVDYTAEVYTRTQDGLQGIEVVIHDDTSNEVESIIVTNQTQFDALVARLDDLNITFPAFKSGSSYAGRTIDDLLKNTNEDVNINATRLNGFQSDSFSKSDHLHSQYLTSHQTVNNWVLVGSFSGGTMYVNTAIRLVHFSFGKESHNFVKQGTWYTMGTIPSGYRPKSTTHLACSSSTEWAICGTDGVVKVARSTTGTTNVRISAMWPY